MSETKPRVTGILRYADPARVEKTWETVAISDIVNGISELEKARARVEACMETQLCTQVLNRIRDMQADLDLLAKQTRSVQYAINRKLL